MSDEKTKLSDLVGNTGATLDQTINISAMLNDAVDGDQTQTEEVQETPLQRAKRLKEEQGTGVPMTKEEFTADGQVKKEKLDVEKDIDAKIAEMDENINAAQSLNIPKPQSAEDLVKTMNILDDVASGKGLDETAAKELNITRKEEGQDKNINYAAGVSPKQQTERDEIPADMQSTDNFNRDDIVQILIDKTGLGGGTLVLSPEEEAKVIRAKKIIVTEVESKELSTIKFKAPTKSFSERISEHTIGGVTTKVTFPASRFSGSMSGLGFGELGDIALSRENITYEKLNKKLTILYNNLKNTTVGMFDNYDDFLSKLAYTDIDFGTFGVTCSTFPEVDTITLSCNHTTCNKPFEHKYSPRSLIRFDRMRNAVLRDMENINKCGSLEESKELYKHSPVSEYKLIKLPFSGYMMEIGIASAKDYLESLMGVLLDEKWNEKHPDDVNNLLQINSTFLTVIRAISVPEEDGYTRYTDVDDLIDVIYTLKPEDVTIIAEILDKYLATYTPVFALVDVRCPHCGTVTKFLPIDINSLVFLKFQAVKNTTVELKGILDL